MVWQAKGSCQIFYFDAIQIQTEEEASSTNISLSFPCCPLSVVGTYGSGTKQTESHLVFSGFFFFLFGLLFLFCCFCFGLFFFLFPFPVIGGNEVSICSFNHKIVVVRIFSMLDLMMSLLKVKYYCFNFLRVAQVFRIYFQKLYIQLWLVSGLKTRHISFYRCLVLCWIQILQGIIFRVWWYFNVHI